MTDLFLADIEALAEVRAPGDATPVGEGTPGVLIFYEVTSRPGPIAVRKDGPDIVLSGW